MLGTILAVLVILWLLGFSLHIGGGLIHILIVIALIVFIARMLN
ncbi:MAG: lmo0937 family membrane protein [Patescibacteria group bacterium]